MLPATHRNAQRSAEARSAEARSAAQKRAAYV